MDKRKTYRLNKETIDKIQELTNKLSDLYPSASQVIRSAVHRLYNEKIRDGEKKNDIL